MNQQSLPSFEGRKPDTLAVALTGTHEFDSELASAHHIDAYVYAIVGARVAKVAHSVDSDGDMIRVETAKVDVVAWLDADQATDLITESRRAERARRGIEELPLDKT